MPGITGHAAAKVISDAKGVMVDGHIAAGVPKDFKMALMSGDELIDGLFGGAKAHERPRTNRRPEQDQSDLRPRCFAPIQQHTSGVCKLRPDTHSKENQLSFNSHRLNDTEISENRLSENPHRLNDRELNTKLLPRLKATGESLHSLTADCP